MMEDLEYQQESTNKLMNIVTSLGQQMRGPVMQYKGKHIITIKKQWNQITV